MTTEREQYTYANQKRLVWSSLAVVLFVQFVMCAIILGESLATRKQRQPLRQH